MNRSAPRVTQATMNQLVAHDWPGNVRELQNAVERAVILSQGGPLRFELPTDSRTESVRPKSPPPDSGTLLTRDDLKRHERDSLIAALKQSGGRIFGAGGAAELLGMKPTTLASRLKALGIRKS